MFPSVNKQSRESYFLYVFKTYVFNVFLYVSRYLVQTTIAIYILITNNISSSTFRASCPISYPTFHISYFIFYQIYYSSHLTFYIAYFMFYIPSSISYYISHIQYFKFHVLYLTFPYSLSYNLCPIFFISHLILYI